MPSLRGGAAGGAFGTSARLPRRGLQPVRRGALTRTPATSACPTSPLPGNLPLHSLKTRTQLLKEFDTSAAMWIRQAPSKG